MMEDRCLCEPTAILIFPCACGSNVEQIANNAAVRSTQLGMRTFFCLAGIGGYVSGVIESTKAGKILVAIDGCRWSVRSKLCSMPALILTSMSRYRAGYRNKPLYGS